MVAISHPQSRIGRGTSVGRTFCRAEDLASVLRRERARADRIHSGFCVVLVGLRDGQRDEETVAHLGDIVGSRARETDEICLVDGRFVCAVLPDTPPAGARRFAESVRASLNGQTGRTTFEVLSYPSTPFRGAGANGTPERLVSFGLPAETRLLTPAGRNGDEGDGAPATYAVDTEVTARDGRGDTGPLLSTFLRHVAAPAQNGHSHGTGSLEAVFARPLPRWKRAMDVSAAVLTLLCLLPLLALIAGAVRLTSGRPVIFKQRRAGLMGRPFEIYKFRTMVVDAERRQAELRDRSEQDGPAFKLTNDPRVTRLGHFLRKTSLDELPQLWNVLKGNMSLVGPRPLPCGEASACSQWQQRRLDVTPGITCIWQVKGRSSVSFPEWMRMDIAYIRSRRLLCDVRLLLLTVPAVLLRRGAK